jgi:hypothetical protein
VVLDFVHTADHSAERSYPSRGCFILCVAPFVLFGLPLWTSATACAFTYLIPSRSRIIPGNLRKSFATTKAGIMPPPATICRPYIRTSPSPCICPKEQNLFPKKCALAHFSRRPTRGNVPAPYICSEEQNLFPKTSTPKPIFPGTVSREPNPTGIGYADIKPQMRMEARPQRSAAWHAKVAPAA